MPETWYAIGLVTTEGDEYHAITQTAEDLAHYVRTMSDGMASMKISAVDPSRLAELRIGEIFHE